MHTCSYCRARCRRCLRFSEITLCPACESALCRLSPKNGEYAWFVNALKQALFP